MTSDAYSPRARLNVSLSGMKRAFAQTIVDLARQT
jgi:hypothetical protein